MEAMEELKLVKSLLGAVVGRLETEAARIESAASSYVVKVAADDVRAALVSLEGFEPEEDSVPAPHYEVVVLETEIDVLTRALSLATARHRRTLARHVSGSEVER